MRISTPAEVKGHIPDMAQRVLCWLGVRVPVHVRVCVCDSVRSAFDFRFLGN